MMPPTPITRDKSIIEMLALTLSHLQSAETLMQSGVGDEAWPKVGRLLSDIERTIKQIEFGLTGHRP